MTVGGNLTVPANNKPKKVGYAGEGNWGGFRVLGRMAPNGGHSGIEPNGLSRKRIAFFRGRRAAMPEKMGLN